MKDERLLKVNRYYSLRPDRLLGKLTTMSRYLHKRTCVESDGRDVPAAVREQIAALRTDWYESTGEAAITVLPEEYQDLPQGAFLEHDDAIMLRRRDKLVSVPKKHHDRVRSALELLSSYMRLLTFERTSPDNDRAAILRKELQDSYYAFVFTFGNLRHSDNFELLSGDPRFVNLMSIEVEKEDGIVQSPIFFHRTIRPMPEPGKCESPSDALAQSLNHCGYVKPKFIGNLLDLGPTEAMQVLSDAGLVFYDPEPNKWVTADAYLSGDVKTKLSIALENQLNLNASALRNVLPTSVLPPADPLIQQECAIALEIPINVMSEAQRLELFKETLAVQLGAVWVPTQVIAEFVCHLMGSGDYRLDPEQVGVSYISRPFSMWSIKADMAVSGAPNNTEKWGTADRRGLQLLEQALNLQDPKIYRKTEDGQILDQGATEACRAKVEAMRADFATWAWRDRSRAVQLTIEYNEKVNRYRHRTYNGEHLTFPGSNPEKTLRPHQKDAVWRALQQVKGMGTLFGHAVGAGKAQPLDAKVLTPSGWVRMGDIHPGDYVITQSGQATLVEAVFPQGEKEIFRVTFSDGSSTECCDEHLWLTSTYAERNSAVHEKKLGKNWECAKPHVRSLQEIRETLLAPHLNAKNHSIPMMKPVEFLSQPTGIDPYLMGYLLGDGHLGTHGISITSADHEVFGNLILPANVRGRLDHPDDSCPTLFLVKISGRKNPLVEYLKGQNLLGKLSYDKFVPDEYKYNSTEVRLSILQGLMDSDGTVHRHSAYFNTVSKQLAEDVVFLTQSLGGTAIVSEKNTSYTHNGEKRQGRLSYQVTVSLAGDIVPFRLTRKKEAYIPKSKYPPRRYITSVEPVGKKEAQCIRVSDPSHLYVTDDFIVTHNTFCLAALCMEARRLGISSKPVIGVLNDTLPGFVDDCRDLYPEAVILYPQGKDMEGQNRQIFINRIATEDFDMAILPHSLVFDIPMSDEFAIAHVQTELWQVEGALNLKGDLSKSAQRRLQTRKKSIDGKVRTITESERKKASLTWEQLGIDMYCLDESQVAKKLGFVTTQDNVAGLDTGESQCGRDTKMKIEYILGRGGIGVFATGTPITNTLAELFNLMRFLASDALENMGLSSFDAWSSLFTETETASEVSPEGGFQVKTRFARFTNLYELMELYWSFADLISSEELGLNRPIPIFLEETVESSEELAQYMAYLQDRATEIRQGHVQPEDDNLLVVVGDGRKSAADLRLVRSNAIDDPTSKLNNAIWCMFEIWRETASVRGTQIVFSNIGTPRTDEYFDLYREIEQKLIALGVPSREIAFVHDAKNSQKKRLMLRKVNEGKIRFLLGSSAKGGTGINAQRRMVALHHVEPDWMPSQIKQREGRIERQGNLFKRVLIFRHLTMGIRGMAGFDAFFWQKLMQKNRFISQVEKRTLTSRHSEDIGPVTMNYASLMAIASGDPMLKDESDLKAEKKRLELRGSAHTSQQMSLSWELNNAIAKVDCAADIEAKLRADAQAALEFDGLIKMGSHLHEDPTKIGIGVLSKVQDALKIYGSRPIRVGVVPSCKFDVWLYRGFGEDIQGILTPDIKDPDCRYPFPLNRTSTAATGHSLIDAIRFGISDTLENFRQQTEAAKTRMKELSAIQVEPFTGAERIAEIDAKLYEIKLKKKELEKEAAALAASKPATSETRVKYGQALLVPPDPMVIDALINRDYQPEWLNLLPGIVEEMRENEAAIEAEQAARFNAQNPTEVVAIKADSSENEEVRKRLLTQRTTFVAAGATQDSLF
jgi:N12 class adenine-specific DNA methylase